MTSSPTQARALPADPGLGEVLTEVERELRILVWRTDRLQDTLGDLIARAGERMDQGAIEEAQGIDLISQRLTHLARMVAQAARAAGYSEDMRPAAPAEIKPPRAGDFEAF
jgi:hypothetical protein